MKRPTELEFTGQLSLLYQQTFHEPLAITPLLRLKQLRENPGETRLLLYAIAQHYKLPVHESRIDEYLRIGTYLVRDYYQLLLTGAEFRQAERSKKGKWAAMVILLVGAVYCLFQGQGVFSLAFTLFGMEIARTIYKDSSYSR